MESILIRWIMSRGNQSRRPCILFGQWRQKISSCSNLSQSQAVIQTGNILWIILILVRKGNKSCTYKTYIQIAMLRVQMLTVIIILFFTDLLPIMFHCFVVYELWYSWCLLLSLISISHSPCENGWSPHTIDGWPFIPDCSLCLKVFQYGWLGAYIPKGDFNL